MATVAVIGAGNVGCALAVDLTLRGHDVRLCTRSERRLDALRDGLTATGLVTGTASLALLTTSVATAVHGADVVAVAVPSPALPHYAGPLADALGDDQLLWLDPGHCGGALYLAAEIARRTGRRGRPVCELSTSSHGARLAEPASVAVFGLPAAALGVLPAGAAHACADRVAALLPHRFTLAGGVLEVDLMNVNAIMHPAQMVLNASWIEATAGAFAIYAEGSGPALGRVVDAVDAERLALAAALGVPAVPFGQLMSRAGYTTAAAAPYGAHAVLQAGEAIRGVCAPPTLDHRYLHEDVGWGLVPWLHLAAAAGVPAPTIRSLVTLAGLLTGNDYAETGLTLERMGLAGVPADRLLAATLGGPPPRR